jgi:prepilin-type N-terminal cleavage/methylation domain-containing protein
MDGNRLAVEGSMPKRLFLLTDCGFTLVELLMAIPLGLLLMAGIYTTFKAQQDSYIVQDQIGAMQQNLRGAMYVITRDLQMAGYLTSRDARSYSLDWDGRGGVYNNRPLIIAGYNINAAGDGIKDNTDIIVIVKASEEGRPLGDDEEATGTRITLQDMDVDLNTSGKKFGVLVKQDLSRADFFQVQSIAGNTITLTGGLVNAYGEGDLIYRVDIIIYKIDDDSTRPSLRRRNLGQDNGYQVVAENVDNMQFRYQLNSGAWTDNPAGSEPNIRAVQVFLVGKTAKLQRGYRDTVTYNFANNPITNPNDGFRRQVLSSTIKIRNLGL